MMLKVSFIGTFKCKVRLRRRRPGFIFLYSYMSDVLRLYGSLLTSVKERHLKKFTNLNKTTNVNDDTNVNKNKWMINLSTKQLSDQEKDLLAKGMNFCITPTTVPNKERIAKVEDAIKNLPMEEADTVRAKVSLTLQATKTPKDNLSKQQRTTLKALKADKSIIILPGDKGRTTVVTDKQDYMNKCYQHINNGQYKRLKKDPTETIKREARNILLDLKKTGYINEQTYYQLKPTDSPPPRFHGLPKIHKQGVPIRPVVSCTGMPLYKLSKFVASILSKYTSSDHCKNSTEFSE